MKNSFTIEEWLTLLEPGIRDKARANWKAQTGRRIREEEQYGSFAAALSAAFFWSQTPEGHNFWYSIHEDPLMETRKPATNRGMIDCTIGE
jgi:hypothetical protein